MYDILAVLVRAVIITSCDFVFFFFFFTTILISPMRCIFDRWMLALTPSYPNCETWCEGRVYFLLSSVCVGTYKHTYAIHVSCIINSRLNKTARCLQPEHTPAFSGLCACYISHVVMPPRISPTPIISRQNPVHASMLLRLLIDHFICKYTSTFNDSNLGSFFFFFSFLSYPKLSLICCASCNNQPRHLSSHPQWCVTCYGAI